MTKPKPNAKPVAAKTKGHTPTAPALVGKGREPQFDPEALRAAQEAIAAATGAPLAEPSTDQGGVAGDPIEDAAPPAATDPAQSPESPPASDQLKED